MITILCFLLVGVASPPGVYSDFYRPLDTYLNSAPSIVHFNYAVPVVVPVPVKVTVHVAPSSAVPRLPASPLVTK